MGDFVANKKESRIYVAREDIKTTAEVEFTLFKNTEEDKTRFCASDVTKVGGEALGEDDFKVFVRGEKRKRQPNKKKKGKKGKGKKFKGGFKMRGQTFIPMGTGGQPQIMMVNGQAFMVMPQGMNMGMNMMGGFGMNVQGGRKNKRRKKNKKKQNKGN